MIEVDTINLAGFNWAGSAQVVAGTPLSTIPLLTPAAVWTAVLIVLMIFSIALVVYGGIRMINQRKNLLGRSRYRLQVINKGNLVAHYLLRAQEPGNVLAFTFQLNGVELKPPALLTGKQAETSPAPQVNKPEKPNSVAGTQPARLQPQSNFMKRTSQFRRASGPFARIISGLSTVLPKSARSGMYQTSAKFRSAQYKVAQADNLAKDVGGVRMAGPRTSLQPAERPVSASVTAAQLETPRPAGPNWLATPAMSPGESLTIDLFITPRNPRLSQEYTFKVLSRCAEWESSPESVESCSLQIKGVSWLSYLWPYAALLISVFAIIAVFIAVIQTYVLI